jgi:hypothetical protein
MITKYTLYTEDKGNLGKIVSQYFTGFTMLYGIGFWESKHEKSIKIEIVDYGSSVPIEEKIRALVREIKKRNKQACVLVDSQEVEREFI